MMLVGLTSAEQGRHGSAAIGLASDKRPINKRYTTKHGKHARLVLLHTYEVVVQVHLVDADVGNQQIRQHLEGRGGGCSCWCC